MSPNLCQAIGHHMQAITQLEQELEDHRKALREADGPKLRELEAQIDAAEARLGEGQTSIERLTYNIPAIFCQKTGLKLHRYVSTTVNDEGYLQTLVIDENFTTEIPKEITYLTQLEEFDISINAITEVPAFVGSIPSLKKLKLSNTLITDLPQALSSLENLIELNIGSTKVQKIPEVIRSFPKLTQLRCNNVDITTVPDWIGELTSLTDLYINGNNKLTTIPATISKLTKLTKLSVGGSSMHDLPIEVFRPLQNLKQLDISTVPNAEEKAKELRKILPTSCYILPEAD